MSNYEWEEGVITLPATAAPKIRKALAVRQNKIRDWAKRSAKEFWVENKTTSVKKYQAALDAYVERNIPNRNSSYAYGFTRRERTKTMWEYPELVGSWEYMMRSIKGSTGNPRQIQEKDLNREFPKATSKTKIFDLGDEARISFNGRKVTWAVEENNHACENAREHPLAGTFFTNLAKIKWTRGSGGVIVGNNEYNRDDHGQGGGGNYVVTRFGSARSALERRRY